MNKKEISRFFRRHFMLTTVVACLIVSALAGGIVGYYSVEGALGQKPALPNFVKQLVNPQTGNSTPAFTDEQSQVISVVKSASPAVVSIVASKDLTTVEQNGYNPFQDFCSDPFFKQFFGDQCDSATPAPKSTTQKQQVAAGTGFLITSDGLILTNKHVVDISGADFTAITSDGKSYPAKILATDPVLDVALVKISGTNFPTLPLADSSQIQIGQTVIAIGNALGQFSNTVSKGVISGLSRSITAGDNAGSSETLNSVIQTDAAINPGNSGGPLLDLSGNVIGINTAIAQGAQNIGFAIPINQAKKDIGQVKTSGKISTAYLGIRYIAINDTVKQENNLTVNYGALVVRGDTQDQVAVMHGSPADIAGIKENDIILEVDGTKIDQNNDLATLLQKYNVGQTIQLKVLSQGKEKTVSVKLAERPQ
jgi:S1-C subfamily serine protease